MGAVLDAALTRGERHAPQLLRQLRELVQSRRISPDLVQSRAHDKEGGDERAVGAAASPPAFSRRAPPPP